MSLLRKILQAVVQTIRDHRAPRWAAEPIRSIANRVVSVAAVIAALLVVANEHTDLVPARYRTEASAALAAVAAVLAVVTKVAAEIARSKVFSPATHEAELAETATTVAEAKAADPETHAQ
jgi:hypothetical protein